ncbi:MAG TPA: ABC transporter permease subunit, partial [Chloroflexia bacterium]|nr:ABC transporter permease subunit [Chloroflexia bacterium]
MVNGRNAAFALFAIALAWALWRAGLFGGEILNTGGWGQVWRFAGAAAHPDLSQDILSIAVPSLLVTLSFAVCGTAVSLIIGAVGGLLSSEVWWQSVFPRQSDTLRGRGAHLVPWIAVRSALAVPRAIHEVIWGLFFLNVLGLDPLVAVLAIGIPFGAITAKVFSEILDEVPRGPLNALQNSGASPLASFLYALLPQAFPDLLSYAFYRLECAIRSVAVLGLIGAGGLGFQVLLSLQSLQFEQVWTFLYLLILLSGATDWWSSMLHRRLQASHKGG